MLTAVFRDAAQQVTNIETQECLASDPELISPFIDQLIQLVRTFIGDGADRDELEYDLETAVRESVANAMVHGNGRDAAKRVWVTCAYRAGGEISIAVRDEGQGFDPDQITSPTSPDGLLRSHGRGIYLMKSLMDEVTFEEGGTRVRLRKTYRGRDHFEEHWLARPDGDDEAGLPCLDELLTRHLYSADDDSGAANCS